MFRTIIRSAFISQWHVEMLVAISAFHKMHYFIIKKTNAHSGLWFATHTICKLKWLTMQ